MIETLKAPCWRLVTSDGVDFDAGFGASHFDDEVSAARRAVEYHSHEGVTPVVWPEPCWLIVCDGCGGELNDGTCAHMHFADDKTARETARCYDFEVGDGAETRVLCPDCVEKRDAADEDEDEDDVVEAMAR